MIRNQVWKAARTITCLILSFHCSLCTSQARASSESTGGRGLGFAYDSARETIVVGTVKSIGQTPSDSPRGLHVVISSTGKLVDAHLGPYFSPENQQALQDGQLVQIIGVNETVRGKKVLLARQLIFNGRLVTVRNERGFLVRGSEFSRSRTGKTRGTQ